VPIEINPFTKITSLDPEFVTLLNEQLKDTSLNGSGIIALNFRDPTYNSESCSGFHPVEIHVNSKGDILCITDFAYFGSPPMVELGIELDWNFEHDSFRQFNSFYDLEAGRALLGLYLANFAAYYASGVYQVDVTTL
jgi:hypothetical protein